VLVDLSPELGSRPRLLSLVLDLLAGRLSPSLPPNHIIPWAPMISKSLPAGSTYAGQAAYALHAVEPPFDMAIGRQASFSGVAELKLALESSALTPTHRRQDLPIEHRSLMHPITSNSCQRQPQLDACASFGCIKLWLSLAKSLTCDRVHQ
jgi:hypothetical protein